MELVIKLKELGFLGSDLLHTTNGREYVTRDQLVAELGQVLREHGGRLALVELPSLLGMDLSHCQAAADALCAASGVGNECVVVANGELFSSVYFAELSREIEDTLQTSGILALASVASAQGLTMEMLTGEVSKSMGTIIHGVFDQGAQSLYTDSYINRVKCQIRGALRGCLHPLQLSVLKKDICGVEGPAGFFPGLVEEVVTYENMDGKIASGMNMWIPNEHLELQRKLVDSYFAQNHYVSVEYARKNGIEDENAYFEKMDPSGFLLDSVYVSPQIVHSLVAVVEDAVLSQDTACGFCDVQDHIPTDFSTDDAAMLVQRMFRDDHLHEKDSFKVFCDTCIVSDSFLEGISQSLQIEAAKMAKKDFSPCQKPTAQGDIDIKSTKNKNSSKMEQENDSDDDWSRQKGSKGKKKGRGGNKTKGSAVSTHSEKKPPTSSQNGQHSPVKSSEYILSHILKMYPELENHDSLAEAITTTMVPIVSSRYDQAIDDMFTAGASRRKDIKEKATLSLQTNFYWLELFSKGTEMVFGSDKDDVNRTSASWHVIKSNGLMCLDPLLHFLNADISHSTNSDSQEAATSDDIVKSVLTQGQRTGIIQECSGQLSEKLAWLVKATNSNVAKDIPEFIDMLQNTAEDAGIRLKNLDKKTETSLTESHKRVLQEQLSLAESSPALLAAAVPILLLKYMHACTNLAGKSLSPAIRSLASCMADSDVAILQKFHGNVLEQLKGDQPSDEETSASLFQKVKSLCE